MSLGCRGLRAEGLSFGLGLGAVDLGLGRAYELRVSRAYSLGYKLGSGFGAVDLGLERVYEIKIPKA